MSNKSPKAVEPSKEPLCDISSFLEHKQLTDFSADGIALINEESVLKYINHSGRQLLGIAKDGAVVGKTLRELKNNSKVFEYVSNLIFKLKTDRSKTASSLISKDGVYFWLRTFQMQSSDSGRKCFVVVIYDATDFLNYQKKISQTEKMASISNLTKGFTHEINNPLAGISNGLYLLRSGKLDKDKELKVLDKIEDGVNRIHKIIENISIFSKLDAYEDFPISIIATVQKAVERVKSDFKNCRIEVERLFPDTDLKILCNENKFLQMLSNILKNSCQAMPEGGEIVVRLKTSGKSSKKNLEISVSDNGCGMGKKEVEQIFDPFYTTKRVWESTGLGLAVSYSIVKLLQGNIEINSKAGAGTQVLITLPLNKA